MVPAIFRIFSVSFLQFFLIKFALCKTTNSCCLYFEVIRKPNSKALPDDDVVVMLPVDELVDTVS